MIEVNGVLIQRHNDLQQRNAANPHTVLSKLEAVPEFKIWMKTRGGHLPDATITGASGENYGVALTYDGTYIWAGLVTIPAKILKINPADNSYTVITGAAGEDNCYALTYDGTYIWAGLYTSPAKILKINPADNSYTVITGASGEDYCYTLAYDGTYIWAGLDTSPAKILKINPADNSYTVITGASGEDYCYALTYDGTYIWAGLGTSPAKILKINPADNSYTVITGASGEDNCYALTYDGTYIWAGLGTSPAKILKINPADNSYTVITGAAGEDYCAAIIYDGTYIWAGVNTLPAKILKKFAHLRKADSFSRNPVDATASRALNTTYTNSSANRTMHVIAAARCAITVAAGAAYMQGKSDSATPPITVASGIVGIQAGLLNEDNSYQVDFYVPPGMNYRIDSTAVNGTVTLGKWFELLL